MLCAVGIFFAWILAEPANQTAYISWVFWLAAVGVVAFLIYVGLRTFCGRFHRPLVKENQPAGEEMIWGGFWITPRARQALRKGETIETFLAGNGYRKTAVWPPISLTLSAMVTALVLLSALVCGTSAISTAATTAQVALTSKPARDIFSPTQVPGLPPANPKEPPLKGE